MKKNLILTLAAGFGWNELEPFFVSMKKFSADVDCVIFHYDLSDWTKNYILRGGEYKVN